MTPADALKAKLGALTGGKLGYSLSAVEIHRLVLAAAQAAIEAALTVMDDGDIGGESYSCALAKRDAIRSLMERKP